MNRTQALSLSLFLLCGCLCSPAQAGKDRTFDYTPEEKASQMQESREYLQKIQLAATQCTDIRITVRYIRGVPQKNMPIDIPLTEEDKATIRQLVTRMKPCKNCSRIRITPAFTAILSFIGSKGETLFSCRINCVTAESKLSPEGYAFLNHLTLNDEDTALWHKAVRIAYIAQMARKMRTNTKP